jgi:hypothetical protein
MGGGEMAANAANQPTINGGTPVVNADGDGLDSNGYATISGGTRGRYRGGNLHRCQSLLVRGLLLHADHQRCNVFDAGDTVVGTDG